MKLNKYIQIIFLYIFNLEMLPNRLVSHQTSFSEQLAFYRAVFKNNSRKGAKKEL